MQFITKEEDIIDLLDLGGKNRAVSATMMNAGSSRSHSLFTLYVQQKAADGTTKTGKLNLVDLAGSEKVAKTGAAGETLEEAKKINQSLSALGNCIHALTEKGRGHVPFRDSKLTRILQVCFVTFECNHVMYLCRNLWAVTVKQHCFVHAHLTSLTSKKPFQH